MSSPLPGRTPTRSPKEDPSRLAVQPEDKKKWKGRQQRPPRELWEAHSPSVPLLTNRLSGAAKPGTALCLRPCSLEPCGRQGPAQAGVWTQTSEPCAWLQASTGKGLWRFLRAARVSQARPGLSGAPHPPHFSEVSGKGPGGRGSCCSDPQKPPSSSKATHLPPGPQSGR